MPLNQFTKALRQIEHHSRAIEKGGDDYCTNIFNLDETSKELNNSDIVDALATIFLQKFEDYETTTISFVLSDENNKLPFWNSLLDETEKRLYINPMSYHFFRQQCKKSHLKIRKNSIKSDFLQLRFHSYLNEMRKLPETHTFFLYLLNEIGQHFNVTQAKRHRKKVKNSPIQDYGYMNLLWAFNKLDNIYFKGKSQNLRTAFNIHWHETDWLVLQKKKRMISHSMFLKSTIKYT